LLCKLIIKPLNNTVSTCLRPNLSFFLLLSQTIMTFKSTPVSAIALVFTAVVPVHPEFQLPSAQPSTKPLCPSLANYPDEPTKFVPE